MLYHKASSLQYCVDKSFGRSDDPVSSAEAVLFNERYLHENSIPLFPADSNTVSPIILATGRRDLRKKK